MKKILFIVNGLGMGNSTRCHSIIENLQSMGYTIDVITSGNGLEYFNSVENINKIWKFKSLNYSKSSDGSISARSTFLNIPKHIVTLTKNVLLLSKVLKRQSFKAIVTDSDYSLFFLKWKINIPVFAINNAHIIVNECKNMNTFPKSIKLQLVIEKLDKLYHEIVPTYVLSPSMKAVKNKNKITNFTPFLRKNLLVKKHQPINNSKVKNCLIMLSGSSFGSQIDFLKYLKVDPNTTIDVIGKGGVSSDNVNFHGKVLRNHKMILKADIFVINAGFSAISEAFSLGVPAVVIPIKNHAEQFINAKIFEELGLGYVANESNVNEKINLLIKNYKNLILNHKKNISNGMGSNEAALFIKDKLKKDFKC